MTKTISVPTSPEVWTVIRARHPELVVFKTISDPCDQYGIGKGRMYTSYGFKHCPSYPIIAMETTWDMDTEKSSNRINEQHDYWICVGEEES